MQKEKGATRTERVLYNIRFNKATKYKGETTIKGLREGPQGGPAKIFRLQAGSHSSYERKATLYKQRKMKKVTKGLPKPKQARKTSKGKQRETLRI